MAADTLMISPAAGKISVFIPQRSRTVLGNIPEEEHRGYAYSETFLIEPIV
jgi:hypothetical protein